MRSEDWEVRNVNVKAMMLCVSCDIPATRKVCGFLGQAAQIGCSKCTKKLKGLVERCAMVALKNVLYGLKKTPGSMHKTPFTRQQLLVAVQQNKRMVTGWACSHTNDPMNHLYLGTARYMVKHLWIQDRGEVVLPHQSFREFQERVDCCKVPTAMGQILATSFSVFKADQLRSSLQQWRIGETGCGDRVTQPLATIKLADREELLTALHPTPFHFISNPLHEKWLKWDGRQNTCTCVICGRIV